MNCDLDWTRSRWWMPVFSLLLVEVILLVLGALNVRRPASRKE